ncbi:cytochrome c biogenesis protein CcsA [Marinicellulosiphila megalodicopiae]|uniref:cytochrome c biogenesis protein CcsA n=1 Tax=Marinicellulosiphila megalodicopiae TaxID=2724896 RepID=UPI003BB19D8F
MLNTIWKAIVAWFLKWGSPKWFFEQSKIWSLISGLLATLMVSSAFIYGVFYSPLEVKGHASRIIFVHVPTASLSMSMYFAMAIMGVIALVWKMKMASVVLKATAQVGAGFAALMFITGAIWGQAAWGQGVVWDPRLISAAGLVLLYFGILALYYAIESTDQADKSVAVLAICTVVIVFLIKFAVSFSDDEMASIHQQSSSLYSGDESAVDWNYLAPLLGSIFGFYFMGMSLVLRAARAEILVRNRTAKWVQAWFDKALGQEK